jgi:hypothetical protein
MVVLAAAFFGAAASQPIENTITTDGGLSVSYPTDWSASLKGAMAIDVTSPDGWHISLAAGVDANYEFTGDAFATPADTMRQFIGVMELIGFKISEEEAAPIEIGIIAGLSQTLTSPDGVPVEAVAYTLPNGMSALAFIGNISDPQTLTPDARDVFHAVLSSVTFEEPIVETEEIDASEEIYIPEGATRISDLAPGTLRFSGDVEATYPDGWTIYSDDEVYIDHNANLIYGQDIFNYRALAIITVQDSADMTVEMFHASLMPMSAALYTGRDDFDPERDVITETLPDGRTLQYLDISDADGISGNIFVLTIDARYWAWVMLTILDQDGVEDRIAEVHSLVQSMTRVLPEDAVEHENFHLVIEEATCDRVLTSDDISESLPYAAFNCPAGCADEAHSIWGSEIYTLDSSLCAAAIHTGAISNADGGAVLATWQPGQKSYASTERNGILTIDYGSWGDSFMVAPLAVTGNE